jgi:hypothetical protein
MNREYHVETALLDHISGNVFTERGLAPGDLVYVVTVLKGKLYLLGRMEVGLICTPQEAGAILGCDPEELWQADEHVIAGMATRMDYDRRLPDSVTRRLRFVSGGALHQPVYDSPERLDRQTMRGVRELSPESAAMLDEFLPPVEPVVPSGATGGQTSDEEFPEGVTDTLTFVEGAARQVTVNSYERSAEARAACIRSHGLNCAACGFSYGETYGPSGEGFIHIHHLKPLSEVGGSYVLDPVADLRPVCPNCHAMIHRRNPPYSLEELKEMLKQGAKNIPGKSLS